jgi:hypothetical protein
VSSNPTGSSPFRAPQIALSNRLRATPVSHHHASGDLPVREETAARNSPTLPIYHVRAFSDFMNAAALFGAKN